MARTRTISDEQLLAAAREVFVDEGLGASTKAIARRAGISEGVLFQRYATKRDLFFAAMVLPAPDPMGRRSAAASRGFDHLVTLGREMTDYFRQTVPVLVPLLAHPGFDFEEFARRHPNSPLDELRRRLVGFLADERRAGRVGEIDPGAAALSVLGIALTIAFFERMGAHGGAFPPELLERSLACLWNGLAPKKAPRPGAAGRRRRAARV